MNNYKTTQISYCHLSKIESLISPLIHIKRQLRTCWGALDVATNTVSIILEANFAHMTSISSISRTYTVKKDPLSSFQIIENTASYTEGSGKLHADCPSFMRCSVIYSFW